MKKLKLKDNTNLSTLNISDLSEIEELYITGCVGLGNTWTILDSILQTGNNLKWITVDNFSTTGTWTELIELKSRLEGGLNDSGEHQIGHPVIYGTWTLPGMKSGEYDIITMQGGFVGLSIQAAKILITFIDPVVDIIISNAWGNTYDVGKKGISESELALITTIGSNFQGSEITNFNQFNLFLGVTELYNEAFKDCSLLQTIELPPNINISRSDVFSGCSLLESITYPARTQTIGSNQTLGCSNLQYVHILRDQTPTINSDSFPGDFPIYVGDGSSPYHDNKVLSDYLANSANWRLYKDRLDTWYNKVASEKLPSGYTRLDYVESDSISYINTGLTLDNNTRFLTDVSFISGGSAVHGSINSGLKTSGDKLVFRADYSDREIFSYAYDGLEHLVDINVPEGYIIDNNSGSSHTQYERSNMSIDSGNLTLFGDAIGNNFIGRTWMTRIYKNGNLVSDLIPASYNTIAGLYDSVRNQFLTAVSGTGFCGKGFDTRLLNEDDSLILLENGDYIKIQDSNTQEAKISIMPEDSNYGDDSVYLVSNKDGDNKKLKLSTLNNMINEFESKVGLSNFSPRNSYQYGSYVKRNGISYKFIESYSAQDPWDDSKVERTYALRELEKINGVDNDSEVTINLLGREYSELNSITSTGTQYIPLFICNGNDDYRFEFKMKYTTYVNDAYIFGTSTTSSYNRTCLQLSGSSGNTAVFRLNSTGSISIPNFTPNIDLTIVADKTGFTLNGNKTNITTALTKGTDRLEDVICLFASSFSSSATSNIGMTLYYFKVYNGSNLILDLIPYYNSGVTGLKNKVYQPNPNDTDDFYPKYGTGNFIGDFKNGFNPMAYKNIDVVNNLGEIYNLVTDNEGKCSFIIRRGSKYKVVPRNFTDYWTGNGKTTLIAIGSQENVYISYIKKIPSSGKGKVIITLNVDSSHNVGDLNGKTVCVYMNDNKTFITKTTNILNLKAVVEIEGLIGMTGTIVYPDVNGYLTPENTTFTIESENQTLNEIIYHGN